MKVRAIADPAAAYSQGVNPVAVARGEFMLGNVGLALEGFRKAQRYNPSDPAALEGIGDCYASMGRLDLAQSSYESALALAPHDPKLLFAVAELLDHQGQAARAAETRAEARTYSRPAASVAAPVPAPAASQARVPVASIGSVTVKLPPAHPAAQLEPRVVAWAAPALDEPSSPIAIMAPLPRPRSDIAASVALPDARAAVKLEDNPVTIAEPQFALPEPVTTAPTTQAPAVVLPAVMPLSLPGAGVRLELRPITLAEDQMELSSPSLRDTAPPPAPQVDPRAAALAQRLIEHSEALAANTPVTLPPARPAPSPMPAPSAPDRVAVAVSAAPRLERLSSGEVALVTMDKPIWQAPRNVQIAAASSVRWVALAGAPTRPNVQILNAARSRGLAASARTVLSSRGWRRVAIGDAPAMQHASVVLYPKSQAALGRRLAAQFGVAARMMKRNAVVLILGRDAVDRIGGPRRS